MSLEVSHESLIQGLLVKIYQIFRTNGYVKLFMSWCVGVFFMFYAEHGNLINIVLIVYFLDLFLGTFNALRRGNFQGKKFFKGATKLLVYMVFLFISMSLDVVLHTGAIIVSMMFAFIVLTDASSILSNLELLGYKTPIFLKKYIKLESRKFSNSNK